MTDREQCFRLYTAVFMVDPGFDRELFDGFFTDCCRYIKRDGQVVSMLFLFPCRLVVGEREYPARYLYAAATDPRKRGQGLMTSLIAESCGGLQDEVVLLKPVTDDLIGFYERSGFRPFRAVRAVDGEKRVVTGDSYRHLARDDRMTGGSYTAMYRFPESLDLDGLAFGHVME